MNDTILRARLHDSDYTLLFAPAGSGKTEELTKNFLKKLALAKSPESCLAITFTNHAVHELKNRILDTLTHAKISGSFSDYEFDKYKWAVQVLNRDESEGWNLLENPERLQIKTIDSFCAQIVKSSPISSRFGVNYNVCENPEALYELAALRLLNQHSQEMPNNNPVTQFLRYICFDLDYGKRMLSELLARRDQWLGDMFVSTDIGLSELRARLEDNNFKFLKAFFNGELRKFDSVNSEINHLVSYASRYNPDLSGVTFPKQIESTDNIADINIVSSLFLNKSGTVRAFLNKEVGFPSSSSIKDQALKQEAEHAKTVYKKIESQLRKNEKALKLFNDIPNKNYSNEEWDLLSHLFKLLPLLAAELHLLFKERKQVDYIEIAATANQVLTCKNGYPSQTLLMLDNTLEHILIDEFQDTSIGQFKLIELLTSGWAPGDGRTLFLVGDPMQSIYEFRASNVGLFIDAAERGIGDLQLQTYQLTANFRSQSDLVEANNKLFSEVFPTTSNRNLNQIAFNSSEAVIEGTGSSYETQVFIGSDPDACASNEANYIADKIESILESEPKANIGVLGLTKSSLTEIMICLRARGVDYMAHDLNPLKDHGLIMDLQSLTEAIFDTQDEVSWIDVLRSGLVGMTFSEIAALKDLAKAIPLGEFITSEYNSIHTELPADTKKFLKVRQRVLNEYNKKPLNMLMKGAYMELGGYSFASTPEQVTVVQQYFDLLIEFEKTPFTGTQLDSELARVYEAPIASTSQVNLMTIHKAKGLEFDYTFIPQSQKPTRKSTTGLFQNQTVLAQNEELITLLCAEVKNHESPLMKAARYLNEHKGSNEFKRVAYVALTRAKKATFITGVMKKAGQRLSSARAGSLFNLIGDQLIEHQRIEVNSDLSIVDAGRNPSRLALRFRTEHTREEGTLLANSRGNVHDLVLPEDFYQSTSIDEKILLKAYQSVVKELAEKGLGAFLSIPSNLKVAKWKTYLLQAGANRQTLQYQVDTMTQLLANTMSPTGLPSILHLSDEMSAGVFLISRSEMGMKEHEIDLMITNEGIRYVIQLSIDHIGHGETIDEFYSKLKTRHRLKMKSDIEATHALYGGQVKGLIYSATTNEFIKLPALVSAEVA